MNARVMLPVLVLALASSGCATQEVRYRSWPPETPAADNAAAIKRAQALIAEAAKAAATPKPAAAEAPAPVTRGGCAAHGHL